MGEPISEQIVRLLDAIENRLDPLWTTDEPLLATAHDRYMELRHRSFAVARLKSRAEAVAALIERGGNLPPTPVVLDDDP